MTLKKVTENIYKSNNDSNIYYIKDINTIIDCGNRFYFDEFKKDLKDIVDFEKVETVVLTHLHYDHLGCFDLFCNAKFYASCEGILCFEKDKVGCILNKEIADMFDVCLYNVFDLELPENYEIISTPGHSSSSICIYDKNEKVLFSGDTLFFSGNVGRCDLPYSDCEELNKSLGRIEKLDYEILCPGHDY